jgi:hypothetical protein
MEFTNFGPKIEYLNEVYEIFILFSQKQGIFSHLLTGSLF